MRLLKVCNKFLQSVWPGRCAVNLEVRGVSLIYISVSKAWTLIDWSWKNVLKGGLGALNGRVFFLIAFCPLKLRILTSKVSKVQIPGRLPEWGGGGGGRGGWWEMGYRWFSGYSTLIPNTSCNNYYFDIWVSNNFLVNFNIYHFFCNSTGEAHRLKQLSKQKSDKWFKNCPGSGWRENIQRSCW